LSEGFGPVMTSTMPSRNSVATIVSIIKVLGDASLRTRKHLVLMRVLRTWFPLTAELEVREPTLKRAYIQVTSINGPPSTSSPSNPLISLPQELPRLADRTHPITNDTRT
jgi:hypothetical protein